MALTLKNLIKLAPFGDKVKTQLLGSVDTLLPDQKFRITELCWGGISTLYQAELRKQVEEKLIEMQKTGNPVGQNDLEEIEAKLVHDFSQKLDAQKDEAAVEELRIQLKKYSSQPFPQDKSDSSPPPQKP